MRWPTIRIIDLLEWVVALAVGLATFRACFAVPSMMRAWERLEGGWQHLGYAIGPTLFGVAIFEGLVLAVERVRGRGPRPWGIGRWIWSMTVIYATLKLAYDFAIFIITTARATKTMQASDNPVSYFSYSVVTTIDTDFACLLAAFLVTARLAGSPAAPSPDGREWSGRVFAAIVVGWHIASIVVAIF